MSWVWCDLLLLIGVSSVRMSWSDPRFVRPVAASWCIRRVCPLPLPSVHPVLRPRALTVNKSWVFDAFAACVGTCRVSEVNGLNLPWPLVPLTLILTIRFTTDRGPSTSAHVFLRSRRRRLSGRWNPSVESSLSPCPFFSLLPFLTLPLSFHLGSGPTTTIVTVPRRHATAGNSLDVLSCRGRDDLGRDVKLSPHKAQPTYCICCICLGNGWLTYTGRKIGFTELLTRVKS